MNLELRERTLVTANDELVALALAVGASPVSMSMSMSVSTYSHVYSHVHLVTWVQYAHIHAQSCRRLLERRGGVESRKAHQAAPRGKER